MKNDKIVSPENKRVRNFFNRNSSLVIALVLISLRIRVVVDGVVVDDGVVVVVYSLSLSRSVSSDKIDEMPPPALSSAAEGSR